MVAVPTKVCKACGVSKPVTEYWAHRKEYGTYQPRCKPCHNKANRASKLRGRYTDRIDRTRARWTEYRQAHPEEPRRCSKCRRVKPLRLFYINGNGYINSRCDSCRKKAMREYHAQPHRREHDRRRESRRGLDAPLPGFCLCGSKAREAADSCARCHEDEESRERLESLKSKRGVGRALYLFETIDYPLTIEDLSEALGIAERNVLRALKQLVADGMVKEITGLGWGETTAGGEAKRYISAKSERSEEDFHISHIRRLPVPVHPQVKCSECHISVIAIEREMRGHLARTHQEKLAVFNSMGWFSWAS